MNEFFFTSAEPTQVEETPVEQPEPVTPEPVLAVATINLPDGFRVGTYRWVNPDSPYIQDCIRASFIVVVPE